VLRQLRMKKPSLPILILTQRTRVEDRVQCLDTGADDYVPKQMSRTSLEIGHIRDELISKIRAAAHSRRNRFSPLDARKPPRSARFELDKSPAAAPAVVAIGISTGGPKALEQILPVFPPSPC
jgi:two-component system, chemotaxis family, protein-glutamate methylesterase/glutaminase